MRNSSRCDGACAATRTHGTAGKKKGPLLIECLPVILMAMPDDLPAARGVALADLQRSNHRMRMSFFRAEVERPKAAVEPFAGSGVRTSCHIVVADRKE